MNNSLQEQVGVIIGKQTVFSCTFQVQNNMQNSRSRRKINCRAINDPSILFFNKDFANKKKSVI